MSLQGLARRRWLASVVVALKLCVAGTASAQTTSIKFQLDWRFEGPAALFLLPAAKGYFKDEKLDVSIDAGNGSGGAVTRVASGAYDIGFADLAALMEFHANNPDAPNKPVAVMVVYNNTPAAVLALKKSGIKSLADLTGKKLGAPVFDAGRRGFPILAKANKLGAVTWISMDPPLRETMLMRGNVDAITGFSFTSLLNLEARGAKAADVLVLPYADNGVKLYGNVIIATPKFIKEKPEALKSFLRAFAKGAKEVLAKPDDAIAFVKERDGIINVELEKRRLRMAIADVIASADARAEGFGQLKLPRLTLMASQVSDAYATKTRVDAGAVWNGGFLPSAAELDILPKK
ncbi:MULTISPECIES: ABC transporter substrate-binding protein [unclassified Roseateles]|uniref:ABC transporter substrate-binding protein n=1 Tax=unclassified Roseateles TaxID=2626991 RepID=UPI0006F3BC97|nr:MULTISPECIES: ABC transporter substrate-binding protein [unclassified Roseateles]KQW42754.1 taurine ABC transporter permease [Pelomonas sp. Root405]KRA69431.1 taurine ABC transporter permease [Pelomonas sp. Root662]